MKVGDKQHTLNTHLNRRCGVAATGPRVISLKVWERARLCILIRTRRLVIYLIARKYASLTHSFTCFLDATMFVRAELFSKQESS